MSIKRINYAGGEDQLTGSTLDQLRADLLHTVIRVYVFVGTEAEKGWKVGVIACGLRQPEYNIYLVDSMAQIGEWVPAGKTKGVVFGTDDQPDRLLDEAEVSVLDIVQDALEEAP